MDGRVKTLHPKIHGGLLGRRGTDDAVMAEHGIAPIDLVVVNLYPFAATVAKPGCTFEDAIENIDIGGPAMVRAAAKNHAAWRSSSIRRLRPVLAEIDREGGGVSAETRAPARGQGLRPHGAVRRRRRRLPRPRHAARQRRARSPTSGAAVRKRLDLRYGENPHQQAAFYVATDRQGASVGSASQLQGKELSFNNLADADTAFECVRQFDAPACVIVKHANPCGVAVAASLREAYDRASHRPDLGLRRHHRLQPAARRRDRAHHRRAAVRRGDRRARGRARGARGLRQEEEPAPARHRRARTEQHALRVRSVNGGLLVQSRDLGMVTRRPAAGGHEARADRRANSRPAVRLGVCKHVKSNAIVFAKDRMTVGVGAGQMSRVVSTRIAAMKARDEGLEPRGSVMASDAFFPFRDGIDAAAEDGITAVIQPGGSMRDAEVIAAADEHGLAMVFTGMRHFRH